MRDLEGLQTQIGRGHFGSIVGAILGPPVMPFSTPFFGPRGKVPLLKQTKPKKVGTPSSNLSNLEDLALKWY